MVLYGFKNKKYSSRGIFIFLWITQNLNSALINNTFIFLKFFLFFYVATYYSIYFRRVCQMG